MVLVFLLLQLFDTARQPPKPEHVDAGAKPLGLTALSPFRKLDTSPGYIL